MQTLTTLRPGFSAAFASVLLVLYFVFAPMGGSGCGGIGVLEPRFLAERPHAGKETDLVVTIRYNGDTFLGPALVPEQDMQQELADCLARGPRTLVLHSDVRSPMRSTRLVMRAAQALGVREIIVSTGVHAIGEIASRSVR